MTVMVISACAVDTHAAGVSNKKYTISKGSGTYEGSITIKIKAKKNYKVYYATGNAKFTNKKLIKSGKTKKFTSSLPDVAKP